MGDKTQALVANEHPAWDPLLLAPDAAAYLGVATDTLLLMARRREIAIVRQSSRPGSPAKFRLNALNEWVRKHEIPIDGNTLEVKLSRTVRSAG